MKRVALLAVLLIASAAQAVDYPKVMTEDGLPPIVVGINVEKLTNFLHSPIGYNPYRNHGCSTVTTQALEPTGISFQLESKVLTRINVDYYGSDERPLAIKTDKGIGLGSSEEDVLKAYPGARIKPNPADPTWHTVIVENADQTKGIVFETNGKTVKSMRAGINPSISFANGCR